MLLWVVEPDAPEQITAKVLEILAHPKKQRDFCVLSKNCRTKYDGQYCKRYAKVFGKVLK